MIGTPVLLTIRAQRPDVSLDLLVPDIRAASAALAAHAWDPAPPPVTPPGDLHRQWLSEHGASLYEEVHRYGNVLSAYVSYRTESPKRRYTKDFPGRVKDVEPPRVPGVDRMDIFCGNLADSVPGTFDKCRIWGVLMVVGQYTLYVEIFGLTVSRADFLPVVIRAATNLGKRLS